MSTVIPFPLARSKRARGLANQLARSRPDRRQKRLDVLLEAEFQKLVLKGVDEAAAAREVRRLGKRAVLLLNARPLHMHEDGAA